MSSRVPVYEDYMLPFVSLWINEEPADDIMELFTLFELNDSLKKLQTAKFSFADPNSVLINDTRFEADAHWAFRFGYAHEMSRKLDFRLSYFEPVYPPEGTPTITATLLNSAVSMMRVSRSRVWGKVTSTSIAKRLAREHKLKFKGEDSGDAQVVYVQPPLKPDYLFLQELADNIDFEFFIDGDTLYYRNRDTSRAEEPRMTFTYYGDDTPSLLKSFKPVVKHVGATRVKMHGADTAKGTSNPSATKDDGVKSVNSTKTVDQTGEQPATPAKSVYSVQLGEKVGDVAAFEGSAKPTPQTTKAKVDKQAKARKRDFLEAAVTADADFIGSPRIRARATYLFQGLDRRLSGKWYATETTHKIDASGAYTVSGQFHRGTYHDGRKLGKAEKTKTSANANAASAGAVAPTIDLNLDNGEQVGSSNSALNNMQVPSL